MRNGKFPSPYSDPQPDNSSSSSSPSPEQVFTLSFPLLLNNIKDTAWSFLDWDVWRVRRCPHLLLVVVLYRRRRLNKIKHRYITYYSHFWEFVLPYLISSSVKCLIPLKLRVIWVLFFTLVHHSPNLHYDICNSESRAFSRHETYLRSTLSPIALYTQDLLETQRVRIEHSSRTRPLAEGAA